MELAVLLVGLEHPLHHRAAAQLRVVFNEGPQVLQQPPGPVLPLGQGRGLQDIGHIPGDDLRVQLRQARAGVIAGVELGVVLDLDAVLVAGLVKFDDLIAGFVEQVHGAVGQGGLLRQGGAVGGRHHSQLYGPAVTIPLLGGSYHLPPFRKGEKGHLVAVDVGVNPGEELLPLCGPGLEAVDAVVILVIEEVVPAAGENGAGAQRHIV